MYEYNEPQIRYNSIFWTFLHNNKSQVGGRDYTLNNGINLFGSVTDVIFENDNSLKVQLGFNTPSYGLSYILYTGYSGESTNFNGYFNTELVIQTFPCNVGLRLFKL